MSYNQQPPKQKTVDDHADDLLNNQIGGANNHTSETAKSWFERNKDAIMVSYGAATYGQLLASVLRRVEKAAEQGKFRR